MRVFQKPSTPVVAHKWPVTLWLQAVAADLSVIVDYVEDWRAGALLRCEAAARGAGAGYPPGQQMQHILSPSLQTIGLPR